MKLKLLTLVFTIFISNAIIGQSLNEYKYIIIPSEFDFLKYADQHELNSLTKFLFEKEGFKTIYDNVERPADLSNNPCLGLTADVFNDSGMFTTKLTIELTNCKNQKILASEIGKSKEKDYKKGFQEALRNAFKSVSMLDYNYVNKSSVVVKESVQRIEPVNAVSVESVEGEIIEIVEVDDVVSKVEDVVEPINTPNNNVVTEIPNNTSSQTDVLEKEIKVIEKNANVLYAQANPLGYQLVDSTPKVIYVLLKSSQENIYFLRYKKGIVYKENNQWFVEYYDLDKLVREVVSIKF